MKVEISKYDPDWPLKFEDEAHRLNQIVSINGMRIEHIGSTSVPGLAAKAIIDILIGVPSTADLDALPDLLMEATDYYYVQSFEEIMPFRRLFIKVKSDMELENIPRMIEDDSWQRIEQHYRQCHVHCVTLDHEFFDQHLLFRDLLMADGDLRTSYESLKRSLATRNWAHGAEYASAKSEFITSVLSTKR